jgi:hypothetical protein
MKKTVFISYHFKDSSFKGEVQKWLEEIGVEVLVVNQKDLTPEARENAKKRIKEQISTSHAVLVLVGDDGHNRPFLDYEVSVARNKQIPTFCIRLSNRSGAAPLEVRNVPLVPFDRGSIQQLFK